MRGRPAKARGAERRLMMLPKVL
ncbi:hypothetical protein CSPAE12_00449 [Colletotrichum incanum]|nr:hypothetical protein CSPAE12_00449 [Colletotrichum incanum]